MAIIRGKAGRYTGEQAARLRRRFLVLAMVMMALLGVGEGFSLSYLWSIAHLPKWLTIPLVWTGCAGMLGMAWWGWCELDRLEAERKRWERGDEGETAVGKVLAKFPDSFQVINDISTPSGNLDHMVVGPTGVFVLDSKNWRGVVRADGSGELLLNGKRLDKDYIRQFVGRIMGVKERICSGGTSWPYFRGLFVFTAARVEASWGQTGQVHCLREDQLWDYIVERKTTDRLGSYDVKRIADAFWKVAHSNPAFTDKATEVMGQKSAVVDTEKMVQSLKS